MPARFALALAALLLAALAWAREGPLAAGGDYAAALGRARASGKLLLVHARLAERPLAAEMERDALRDDAVERFARGRFLVARVEPGEVPPPVREALGGIGALDTFVVDGDGALVAARAGFLSAAELLGLLERAWAARGELRSLRDRAAHGGSPRERLALGERSLELGCTELARSCFEAALATAGEDSAAQREVRARAHERLARVLAEQGACRDARKELEAWRALDSGEVGDRLSSAQLTEALVLRAERRGRESLALLEQRAWGARGARAPRADDEPERVALLLAELRHDAGDDAGALAALEPLERTASASRWTESARALARHIRCPPAGHEHEGARAPARSPGGSP